MEVSLFLHHPGRIGVTSIMFCTLLGGLMPFFMMYWLLKQSRMKMEISSTGIDYSDRFKMVLLGRLSRPWSDIHSIKLEEDPYTTRWDYLLGRKPSPADQLRWSKDGKAETPYMMQIDYKSGGNACIYLSRLTKSQCRCLFQAIETWVEQSKLSKDTIKLKH